MTTRYDTPNEFPTLDLDELETAPPRPAVYVSAIERDELPGILAAALPTVVHARRHISRRRDLHEFVDTTTGAAVRYVLILDERGNMHAEVAEAGPHDLWDRIVIACDDWERAGRPAVADRVASRSAARADVQDRVIRTRRELGEALAATFVAQADAGEHKANDDLIQELAGWRSRQQPPLLPPRTPAPIVKSPWDRSPETMHRVRDALHALADQEPSQ